MASMTKSLGGKGSELAGAPPTVDMDVGFRVRAEDFLRPDCQGVTDNFRATSVHKKETHRSSDLSPGFWP